MLCVGIVHENVYIYIYICVRVCARIIFFGRVPRRAQSPGETRLITKPRCLFFVYCTKTTYAPVRDACITRYAHGHRFISETFNWKNQQTNQNRFLYCKYRWRAHPRRARRPPLSETITRSCWRGTRVFSRERAVAAAFSFCIRNNRDDDDNVKKTVDSRV